MRKIGVFGGTFNPPHLAHKRLILEAIQTAGLHKVIVIPTNVPPHKQADNLLSGEERLTLCKLTFSEDIFEVSDMEIERQGKSYTADTLELLKRTYPDDELYLIIGSDMLLTFHQWVRNGDILKMAKLIVTTRQNEISNEMLYDYAKKTLSLDRDELTVLRLDPMVLSSTEIRKIIKKGGSTDGILAKGAAKYITEKGFYR